MRYRFIHAEKANYPLWLLCSTMQVSTKGYYSWLHCYSPLSVTNAEAA